MLNYYIQTYITPENTVTPQLSAEEYKEWVLVAEPIWAQAPYNEQMDPEERTAAYGAKLGRAYAAVCFAREQQTKKLMGYSIGYPVNKGDLREISSGAEELESSHAGVRTAYYIDAVGVSPDFDDRGIGPHLMERMINIVRSFGFSSCLLRTSSEELKHICDVLGFRRTGIFDKFYTDREYLMLSFINEMEVVYTTA